jgi:hypothetical protein
MSLLDTYQAGWKKRSRTGLSVALAGLGLLALCFGATAQVAVDTIGGGVRIECDPAYGFLGGNTYEAAQFNAPYGCALDTNGNLWIADKNNSDIEQVSQAGNKSASVTTEMYATSGTAPHVVTNLHWFTNVTGVAVDPGNNLYVLLPSPPLVVKYSLSAEATSLNALSALVLTNTPASAVASALAVDGSSNVFLAFTNGVILRFQLLDSNPPPTVYTNNYALGASAAVHYVVTNFHWAPAGLALRADGSLAVSDTLSNAIYIVSTNDSSVPQLLAGAKGAGFDDGEVQFAQFNQPHGLAASADGRLIVCDTANNRVRVIDTATNTTTLYGTSSNIWPATCCNCDPTHYAGWVDGAPGVATNSATGREPVSVTIGPSGSLFVTEIYYSLIREVTGETFVPVNLSATYPVAVTGAASGIGFTNATLNGTVNAGDEPTFYYFEWGLTTSYNNYTATNLLSANLTIAQPVSAALANLLPGTTYHFQLVASNSVSMSFGGDATLVTLTEPAVVATLPATAITVNSATLNASVDPEYSPTAVVFQWGTTTNLGTLTPPENLTNNLSSNQTVSVTLSNLQPGTIYYFQVVAYNSGGTSYGSPLVFSTVSLPPPTISFSPSNGYFPECVSIAVTSSAPLVYYTTDGTTPTTNSTELVMTQVASNLFTNTIQWCNSQHDLSYLQLIAVSGTSSTLMQGGFVATNSVGFPQPLTGGPGGHLYIPVVVDLQSNVTLKSIQFRVEITPIGANTNMIPPITLQPLTATDFVPLPGPAPGNAPVIFDTFAYTTSSNGQGLVITASGASSGLDMQSSGVVVMLHVQIPTNTLYGSNYSLNVLDPSGTSDGQQASVGLTNLPSQTLTNSYTPYMVGDSSPGTGYNAGQFGIKSTSTNGLDEVGLDNADVNNAIYASVGIRVPPSDSDAYNAMDAWPPDSTSRGGDGFIRLLDWETILGRSLGVAIYPGLVTNNYLRYWSNSDNGYPSHSPFATWVAGGPPVLLSLDPAPASSDSTPVKLALSNSPPGLVWFCEASIGSGIVINALPGNTYSLPVYVNVSPGYSLAALQFRAIVTGSSGAPAVSSIQFNPAAGMPAPLVLPGLSGNDQVQAWSFGSFAAPLQNSNYLGTLSFQVPSDANAGACYALHFSGVDGAPDFSTAYQLESFPGFVWVMSAAQQPPSITSDEWKIAFFGSLTNSLAGDDVDADGDGAPNWQEYLAGTNPTNALSRFQFSSATFDAGGLSGIAINWLTAPGKGYVLQSSATLNGAQWTPINTNSGDGNYYQFIVTNYSGNARFYQIRLQP